MRWIRCIFWAFWSLALIATISAWIRTHMFREVFVQTDYFGEVKGLVTGRNELLLFKNSNQKQNREGVDLPLGFSYYNDARPANLYDQHALFTHSSLNGVVAVGGPFPVPPPTPPVFTSRWDSPGIAVRGCSYNRVDCEEIVVSFWLLICALMIVPAESVLRLAIRVRRTRRRRQRGLCLTCGYDLRESNECCPECGTAFPPKNPRVEVP